MICISRRRRLSSPPRSESTSLSSNLTSPRVGSMSRRRQRPTVDLPQPDSPTSPKVSPRNISNVTPSTARQTSSPPSPAPGPFGLAQIVGVARGGGLGPRDCLHSLVRAHQEISNMDGQDGQDL